MARKVVVKSKVKKVKRKFPVEIKAPEVYNSITLGKSNITDLKTFVGKTIKLNLMYVTKSVRNLNARIAFRVSEVESGVAKTNVLSYEQIPYYLNRFVKEGSDLVEDSFVCKSKDGLNVRVKPFIITKKNTTILIASAIRAATIEIVEKDIGSRKAEEFVQSVTSGRVQKTFRNELKKIFPLKAFEFKKVEVEY